MNNYLNYLKPNGDSTTVISVYIYNTSGSWGINEIITKSFIGEGSCLSSGGMHFGSSLGAMQNKVGADPSGLIVYNHWLSDIEYRNSPTYNLTQPAIEEFAIAVKSIGSQFLAYVSDSLSQNEIFAETPWYYTGAQNISQCPGDDRNPQFFVTFRYPSTIRVNLIWESERQGFYTIYSSNFDYFFGGIDENPKTESIFANPCPFDQQTTIRFQATGKTNVRILDLQGREVKKLLAQMEADGWQNAIWDGTNFSGNQVPSGSYVVVCGSGNEAQSRIMIKK